MDETMKTLIVLATFALPILEALIKRFKPLSELPSYLLTYGLCAILAVVYNMSKTNVDVQSVVTTLGSIFALATAFYAVLKVPVAGVPTIDRIEGVNAKS